MFSQIGPMAADLAAALNERQPADLRLATGGTCEVGLPRSIRRRSVASTSA